LLLAIHPRSFERGPIEAVCLTRIRPLFMPRRARIERGIESTDPIGPGAAVSMDGTAHRFERGSTVEQWMPRVLGPCSEQPLQWEARSNERGWTFATRKGWSKPPSGFMGPRSNEKLPLAVAAAMIAPSSRSTATFTSTCALGR